MQALEDVTLLNCVVKNQWNTDLQLIQPAAGLVKIIFVACKLQQNTVT